MHKNKQQINKRGSTKYGEKHPKLKNLPFKEWLHLLHHLHHYKYKNRVTHEMHHCFLFTKKNKKGEMFKIKHLLRGDKLYHVLEGNYSRTLFDHANNSYKITPSKLGKKIHSLIKFKKKGESHGERSS